jgi:hypothetical protein
MDGKNKEKETSKIDENLWPKLNVMNTQKTYKIKISYQHSKPHC